MLEKDCKQGNDQGNELPKVYDVIGYHALPSEDGLRHFIRPLYPTCSFPRFHLKITQKDSGVNAELRAGIH